MKKIALTIAILLIMISLAGCWRPYPQPEYIEINTNQTAFVVPMDGDFKEQGKLDSVQAYEDKKVMAKRIQIEKRWLQTGHEWLGRPNGEWIPTIQVFVVDRSPQARHWTGSQDTGTAAVNQSFRLQSKNGVRFFVDYNCTGNILEEDAAKFLYFYPYAQKQNTEVTGAQTQAFFTSLSTVMDTEVWTMVQVFSSEFSTKYNMEDLKAKKAEMNVYVRDGVIAFFKERGINISTLGIAGDFSYVEPTVQTAINEIFTSQQQLMVEQAALDSMQNKIARLTAEGISEANKIYESAVGEADAIRNRATGEAAEIVNQARGQAEAIGAIATACLQAEGNPLFIPTKELQIEAARIKRWESDVPRVVLNGSENQPLQFMNLNEFMGPIEADTTPTAPPQQ